MRKCTNPENKLCLAISSSYVFINKVLLVGQLASYYYENESLWKLGHAGLFC